MPASRHIRIKHAFPKGVAFIFAWMVSVAAMAGSFDLTPPPSDKETARHRYEEAATAHADDRDSAAKAVHLARTAFDLGEFITDKSEKADVAEIGIAAAHRAIDLKHDTAEARFYLGMNNGQLARTRTLGALSLVKHIESNLEKAIEIDAKFQNACPHLYLAILYKNAPGWPASVGNKKKSRANFEKAVQLAPLFPYNRIRHVEALIEWNDEKEARKALKDLKGILPKARERYEGPGWSHLWKEWTNRIEIIERELSER